MKAESVFLFNNPKAGAAFGYDYDGWHSDGTFHYTGDGQEGDQSLDAGGNKALMDAPTLGRTVRVFRSEGVTTTYVGAFKLAHPPSYRTDARDKYKEPRSVLVFRLLPLGDVARGAVKTAPADSNTPEELALERDDIDSYVVRHPDEPPVAVRREAKLVKSYSEWLSAQGQTTVRHRIPLPGGGYLFTDLFNKSTAELIEAKASSARVYIRGALGQILDYSRFLEHSSRSLLLPQRPTPDMVALLHAYRVGVIWPVGNAFERSEPPTDA